MRYRLTLLIGGDKCFVCGWNEANNDICHLTSVKKGGKEEIENMILLCPNHHRMLDRGLLEREELASLVRDKINEKPEVLQNRINH
jgi:predicted restriction endonuclease